MEVEVLLVAMQIKFAKILIQKRKVISHLTPAFNILITSYRNFMADAGSKHSLAYAMSDY